MTKNLVFTIIAILGLAACVGSGPTHSKNAGVEAAGKLSPADKLTQVLGFDTKDLDTSVRAQDDFFRHVNGGWLDRTEIPADRSNYGSFSELRDMSEATQREIIEEAASKPQQPGTDAQRIGDFYTVFMDESAIEKKGIEPIRPFLALIDNVRTHRDLMSLFGSGQRYGWGSPIRYWIGQNPGDTTQYVPFITQAGLSLPDRDYYLSDDDKFAGIRSAYVQHIEKVFALAGRSDGPAAASAILALETKIATLQWARVRNRDRNATYNPMPRDDFIASMPEVDLAIYLESSSLGKQQEYVIRQPDYLDALAKLIVETPVNTWQHYLRWHLIDAAAEYLPRAFVDADFEFYGKKLRGVQEIRPRWKRAVSEINAAMGESVGKLYVERTFAPIAKTRMDEMVENLRQAFRESIDVLEWMSNETKAQAQQKLAKFTPKIGYPDKWRDYSTLKISDNDLVANMIASAEFSARRELSKLGGPIDRNEWFMTPQTVNAYYSPSMNEIVFPAAILQPPFFNVMADDAVNYGAIGAVIGHEFSHGFDDQGRKSDGDGMLRDWWTEGDAKEFKRRADGLVAQYNAFSPLPGENVNGKLTLGENIGDLAGLTMAYRAYVLSLNGKEAPVIGGYTGAQRFFMGWSQVWRREYRDDELRRRLLTDSHSPSIYRVNGIVANMPEFYAAFDVKPGDKLYRSPEDRVKIW